MKLVKLNFIIDIIAFVGFVLLTTTGVLMRYILPPGSGRHSTIWNLDRHDWGGIHFWISVGFFAILAVHLLLHWRWIVNVIKGHSNERSGLRFSLGIVGLITAVALGVSPIFAPVEIDLTKKSNSFLSEHKYEGFSVRGTMTFGDLEQTTGVPASYIISMLKLPVSISLERQLGSLKKQYGFELNDIRDIIKAHKNNKLKP